ncbi:MAG: dephospho-CoA kinase [Selenomonadaceae bacterium]|nr:dephospho-CoA kinase [Selenomonadaceae bacterium]
MYIIGLTGGIACGKSAIADLFKKFDVKTFDVDRITHKLLQCGGELYNDYVQHFGKIIVGDNRHLDKRVIADIIFNNESERLWVNSIAHPVILNRTRDFLVECAENGEKLVVLEIPLLFEAGWEFLVDEIWAVCVSPSKQHWRLMQRDCLTWKQADAKINAQMSAEEIAARADFVIYNNKPSSKVRKSVVKRIKKILSDL